MIKTFAFALLLAAAPQTALAKDASTRVGYADLNLASAAGVAELDRRIDRAIDRLCSADVSRQLSVMLAVEACRAEARRSTAPQRAQALASAGSGNLQVASGR